MIELYVDWLRGGPAPAPLPDLPPVLVIDDPTLGHLAGPDAAFTAAAALTGISGETLQLMTVSGGLTLLEGTATIGDVTVPVAAVVDAERIPGCCCLRTYYSRYLLGGSRLRPPFLAVAPVEIGDVVERYQKALAAGDLEGLLRCLADDVTVREPSGDVHAGREVRAFYADLLRHGGVGLQHHTVIDDGSTCALEYSLVSFSGLALVPQAGLGVYVRSGDQLGAIRLYDDPAGP